MRYKFFLIAIIAFTVFLRFFQLGINPPSLTWDEVALGYNAYSLGIDGKDEFGNFLPIAFIESFGDYKPPAYAYLDILPIKIWGLTEFAVRFPSALFGSLTVITTYFLIKRIFFNSKEKDFYALAGAGILAFSPWHIMLSRAAFEANIATFFLVAGIWSYLAAVQERKSFLIISAICFALSLYSFNSSRVVAPLLVIILVTIFHKTLFRMKKHTLIAGAVGLIMILPLIPFMLSPQAKVRFQEVNIFTDPKLIENRNQQIVNDHNSLMARVLHNHRVVYGLAFLDHYFDHFDPGFLFMKGDINPKFSIQDTGQLYLVELPFLLIGALYLFRRKEGYWWIVPVWLVVGLIPAGTARETPHALRTEAVLPTYQIIVGFGLVRLVELLNHLKGKIYLKRAVLAMLGLVFMGSVAYFQYEYYVHYPIRYSADWQEGYKESIAYVQENKGKYQKIYDMGGLGRPYIYYLFYTKTDPQVFRQNSVIERDVFGFVDVKGFDQYLFPSENEEPMESENNLYIKSGEGVPEGGKKLKEIKRLDGITALTIYTY